MATLSAHEDWPDSARLARALDPLLPGLRIERVAETGSTSTDLLERVRLAGVDSTLSRGAGDGATESLRGVGEGADEVRPELAVRVQRSVESAAFGTRGDQDASRATVGAMRDTAFAPCLLVAERQTAGRGRHGRSWQSTTGRSLTFSLACTLAGDDWSGLSLAVGVALADALDPALPGRPLRIGLKWPNDLWLLDGSARIGRKLGGVLIESVPHRGARVAVIGIGINVQTQAVVDASSGVASWQEIEAAPSAGRALERVAAPLLKALRLFERDGFVAFADRFAARDALRDRRVCTSSTTTAASIDGIAEGVTSRGALRVRAFDGVRCIESGEVSVRVAAPC